MMSPSDRPSNYGGTLVAGSLGANWQLPWHDARGPQLAVEVGIPLYQRVYGIQAPRDWRIATAIRQMF